MKLPLRWGLLLLLGIWALHSSAEADTHRMLLLVAGMGVALWTAFSLKIPPRKPGDQPSLWPTAHREDELLGRREQGEAEPDDQDGDAEAGWPDDETPGPNGGKPMN